MLKENYFNRSAAPLHVEVLFMILLWVVKLPFRTEKQSCLVLVVVLLTLINLESMFSKLLMEEC